MNLTLSDLIRQAVATAFAPRDAAQDLLAQRIPAGPAWQSLIVVTLLAVILMKGAELVFFSLGLPILMAPIAEPYALALVLLSFDAITVLAIVWGGRAFGGTGQMADAIVLVAWLQFVMLCLQVLQVVFLLILPILSTYVSLLGLFLFFWLLTNFVAVIHGFQRLGPVFAGILGAMLGISFVLVAILALIGFQMPEVPANV